MFKNTKTYKCDHCGKQRVLDFYDESNAAMMANIEKEMADWITLRVSAQPVLGKTAATIPEIVGHACSRECVKQAIATMVKRQIPE